MLDLTSANEEFSSILKSRCFVGTQAGIGGSILGLASGALLLSFALAMSLTVGVKAVFDYSVLSGACGAFVVALHAGALRAKT